MMEIGIFSKESREVSMRVAGFTKEEIAKYRWPNIVEGHEVVFDSWMADKGIMSLVGLDGEIRELEILREWCKDFRPLCY